MKHILSCSLILLIVTQQLALADHKPLWELHAGIATLQVPHYRGSEAEHNFIIPFPGLIYRGEKLKASEDGVRGLLFSSERNLLDISFGMGLPASSDENDARHGMPKLETSLEVGPSFVSRLWQSEQGNTGIWLNAPLRMAFSFDDFDIKDQGLIFSPYLHWRHKQNQWKWGIALGLSYADENYHNYFYEVDQRYATPTRPEYHPSSGYSGERVTLSVTKHFKKSWLAVFMRYENLSNAVFKNSPLVETETYQVFGLVYTHLITESKQRSHHSEHIEFD